MRPHDTKAGIHVRQAKLLARARAIVPLPLAAGPSTAMTSALFVGDWMTISSTRQRALTGAYAYGKARRRTPGQVRGIRHLTGVKTQMVKPEWGAKRTCPKCSTRFYDLGKDDPVHCIECGTDFLPEPVLKSKQPLAFEAAPVAKEPRRPTTILLRTISRSTRTRKPAPTRKSIWKRVTTTSASRRPARTTKARIFAPAKFPLFQRGKFRLRREGRGAVAQLGERRNGIAKVRGSIPLGSTIQVLILAFRSQF